MAASLGAIPCLLLLLVSTAWSYPDPIDFIFHGFDGTSNNLTLDGAARVTTEGALQLTNFTDGVVGHAFYSSPVRMLVMNNSNSSEPTAVSFSTTFVFDIVDNRTRGAEGFAFVIAQSTAFRGANSGQFLGLLRKDNNGNFSNHLFAVVFDTFMNNGTDGSHDDMAKNRVGVDINSIASNFSAPAAYETDNNNVSLCLDGGNPIQAWIDYDGETKVLNVTISPFNVALKPAIPLISRVVDLSSVFRDCMYVGFSSSTGQYFASSHFIMGWSFRTNGTARPLDVSRLSYPRLTSATSKRAKTSPLEAELIAMAATLVLVILAALAIWYLCKRENLRDDIEDWELGYPRRLPYKDLYRATKGFDGAEILGSGGFGKVYRGVLPSTREEVAIKKISHNSRQGLQEFVAEIACLGRMRHRHLVQLHGWCKKNADLLLIYEFMPNGSLDQLLYNKEKGVVLSWEDRFKILKGIALGLLYLHEEFDQVVVHRDIKSSNVLLDAEMNGKLSDFGLAKLYDRGQSAQATRVVGTLGYMAPELSYTAQATTSSDVYSYGVLLLEVACGQKPIEPCALGKESFLLECVKEYQRQGQLLQAVDPRLGGCYVLEEVELVINLGLQCCRRDAELRPTMRRVTHCLNGDDKLGDDASLVLSDAESFEMASVVSCSGTSYGTSHEKMSRSFPGSGGK